MIRADDGVRAGTSAAGLGKLRAVFKKDGSTTAGNSSQAPAPAPLPHSPPRMHLRALAAHAHACTCASMLAMGKNGSTARARGHVDKASLRSACEPQLPPAGNERVAG